LPGANVDERQGALSPLLRFVRTEQGYAGSRYFRQLEPQLEGRPVLWLLVLILVILAVAGGVALSPLVFLLLILALVFAVVAARA